MAPFQALPPAFNFALEEEQILELWDRLDAFKRSISQRKSQNAKPYSFYDGPPFATGLPHYGHLVTSSIKDIVARYWTMRGAYVERRFGWDTHGLPIEMETEKALGLSGPQSIRNFGIAKFNEACRAGVLQHTRDWRRVITRLGRWVDFDNDYKTMDRSFMESIWWVFAELWKKDLIFQGFRVMPYSVRLSTPLSNFEANLEYQEVQDPALSVKAKLIGQDDTYLLIWTTTPWTLPANLAIAVGADISYVKVQQEQEDASAYIVAEDLVEKIFKKPHKIIAKFLGRDLLGLHYEPIYKHTKYEKALSPSELKQCFKVIAADHVTTDAGTGLVHMAPAFGIEDFNACKRENIALIDPLNEEGIFGDLVPDLSGLSFKDADKIIIKNLKDQNLLFDRSVIVHSYPFCWRSHTPLIYKAVPVWFVNVPRIKERMSELNQNIHWVPEAVGHKRFANWLKDAADWSISRNRFWGTPIPIWQCDKCEEKLVIASAFELEAKTGQQISDLHSHFIDQLSFACEKCPGLMKRIPEVFDCWFESGSMPAAQMHFPFENQDYFAEAFPADFIAEGLDQTRGWFYTLLVIATALFDKEPFKNCVVNGMVLAADGSKMSKSKKNYPDPEHVINQYGSDALRAYLVGSPVVRAEPLQFNELGVKEVVRSVLLPLYNSWSFFVQYANIDDFDPKRDLAQAPKIADRAEIDRWILSRLQTLIKNINTEMNGYYLYKTIPPMLAFIDDLTNWYIRRSRRRFWKDAKSAAEKNDKLAAYASLYEVLVTFAHVVAPLMPFLSETLYQNLVVGPKVHKAGQESVHLSDFPESNDAKIDSALEHDIMLVRQVVAMGRALREKHRLKIRQPLRQITVVSLKNKEAQNALLSHAELITSELNIRKLTLLDSAESLCDMSAKPNFKSLGPKLGKDMSIVAKAIEKLTLAQITNLEAGNNIIINSHEISAADIIINREAKADMVVMSEADLTVALDTELDQELKDEALMRETVSLLQRLRKSSGLELSDRVKLELFELDQELLHALKQHENYIKAELLASELFLSSKAAPSHAEALAIEDKKAAVILSKL